MFLPGTFYGQRSLVGCSPWGHKELDMTEQLSTHFGKTLANFQGEKTLWGKHTPMPSSKNFFQSFVMLFEALCIFCRWDLNVCVSDLTWNHQAATQSPWVLFSSPNPPCLMPLKKKEKSLIPKAWIPNSAGTLLQDTKLLYCGYRWRHGIPYSWDMDTTSAIEVHWSDTKPSGPSPIPKVLRFT